MLLVKNIGAWLLWGLRLGIVLTSPLFLFLCCLLFMVSSSGPVSALPVIALLALLMVVAALYIGWYCDLALPLQRPQVESVRLPRYALLLIALQNLFLLAIVGLTWIHSDVAAYSNTVGLRLHFVPEYMPSLLGTGVMLATGLLFMLMVTSIARNYRQLRLLVAMVALSLGFILASVVLVTEMTRLKLPEWQIRRYLQSSDKNMYFFLQENPVFRGNNFTAVGRQIAANPFFNTVEIIVLDKETRHSHGALLKGMKHSNAEIALVSKKLLALDRYIER